MEAKEIRYSHLDVDTLPDLTAVQAAIIRHGLPILNNEDVERYQKEVEDAANKEARKPDMRLAKLSFAGSALFVISAISSFIVHQSSLGAAASGLASLMFVIGCKGVVQASQYWEGSRWRWQWVRSPYYGGHVHAVGVGPVFAPPQIQKLASTLWREGVGPMIEYLQQDPFLMLVDQEDHNAIYYVAVWDEKGFVLPR